MTWKGNENDTTGLAQFEEHGPWIKLENFEAYMYLYRLFDIRKRFYQLQGKREALSALRNYVEGMK